MRKRNFLLRTLECSILTAFTACAGPVHYHVVLTPDTAKSKIIYDEVSKLYEACEEPAPKLTEQVPHISFFPPIATEDVGKMKQVLSEFSQRHAPLAAYLDGYGEQGNFLVIFTKLQGEQLSDLPILLARKLQKEGLPAPAKAFPAPRLVLAKNFENKGCFMTHFNALRKSGLPAESLSIDGIALYRVQDEEATKVADFQLSHRGDPGDGGENQQ